MTPWEIIKKGTVIIDNDSFGKTGNKRPNISFWLDDQKTTRVAVWISGEKATYQVTKNNNLISSVSSTLKDSPDDELPF